MSVIPWEKKLKRVCSTEAMLVAWLWYQAILDSLLMLTRLPCAHVSQQSRRCLTQFSTPDIRNHSMYVTIVTVTYMPVTFMISNYFSTCPRQVISIVEKSRVQKTELEMHRSYFRTSWITYMTVTHMLGTFFLSHYWAKSYLTTLSIFVVFCVPLDENHATSSGLGCFSFLRNN